MTLDQRDRSIISQVAVKGAVELIASTSNFADLPEEAFLEVLQSTSKSLYDTIIHLATGGADVAAIQNQFPGAEVVPNNVVPITGGYVAQGTAAGPAPVPGVASGSNTSDEAKWQRFFSNPAGYYDNRGKKQSERSPDFKEKAGAKEALWINSKGTPQWVYARLNQGSNPAAQYQPEPF